jgi:hypothetical protein
MVGHGHQSQQNETLIFTINHFKLYKATLRTKRSINSMQPMTQENRHSLSVGIRLVEPTALMRFRAQLQHLKAY